MSSEWDDELDGRIDRRVRIEYRDRGKFETQFQVASDLLIFRMHTDVFEFDANHLVWQSPYVQADRDNSYCGIIDIYNFLSDSFKFNRNADEGYLIGRIFINRERCYFVGGNARPRCARSPSAAPPLRAKRSSESSKRRSPIRWTSTC